MLNNRTSNNFLIPNKITATDLYRINDMFEQIKAIEGKIFSLFLKFLLGKLQEIDNSNPHYSQKSGSQNHKKLADEIKAESVYLVASYESLEEAIKEFHGAVFETNLISAMTAIKATVDNTLKMVSLVG